MRCSFSLTIVFLCSLAAAQPARASSLAHVEEVAPGVYAAGFAARHQSANCGWLAIGDHAVLVDVPPVEWLSELLSKVDSTTGGPARTLVLTHFDKSNVPVVEALLGKGIAKVVTSAQIRASLLAASDKIPPAAVRSVSAPASIGGPDGEIVFIPLDGILGRGGAAIHLARQNVLFAGPFILNGPRSQLSGTDTQRWVAALRRLDRLDAARIVPGSGTWGAADVLTRQRRFLEELRRQVGYLIAKGRPKSALATDVLIGGQLLVWMPGDRPTAEDIEHVYHELTVPAAPYNGRPPETTDDRSHALVLIGDYYHEPGHIRAGLRPVFEAAGVVPHFTVDVKALTAENLAKVPLLVVLRDGLQHPGTGPNSNYVWMTDEQQRAVAAFVEGGGAFLNLHNSMGLYPPDGPYLNIVGGRYIGHGPLERFRVEVVDPHHPITRGVEAFSTADEQHTPPYDDKKVHLLLQNRSDEGKVAAAGWAYEPGKGRLCHLANGHTRTSLLHPMYQRLMRNAVNWLLRRDTAASRK